MAFPTVTKTQIQREKWRSALPRRSDRYAEGVPQVVLGGLEHHLGLGFEHRVRIPPSPLIFLIRSR